MTMLGRPIARQSFAFGLVLFGMIIIASMAVLATAAAASGASPTPIRRVCGDRIEHPLLRVTLALGEAEGRGRRDAILATLDRRAGRVSFEDCALRIAGDTVIVELADRDDPVSSEAVKRFTPDQIAMVLSQIGLFELIDPRGADLAPGPRLYDSNR